MTRLFLAVVTVVFSSLLLTAPSAHADLAIVQTDIYGSEEMPPVDTLAYGFVRFFFNDDRSAADYTVDVKGLATGLVLGADLHRGAAGENGPVIKNLARGGFIVTSGRLHLSDDDLGEILDGMWYVSLKTVDHPEGELRGQIQLPEGFIPRELQRTLPPPPEPEAPLDSETAESTVDDSFIPAEDAEASTEDHETPVADSEAPTDEFVVEEAAESDSSPPSDDFEAASDDAGSSEESAPADEVVSSEEHGSDPDPPASLPESSDDTPTDQGRIRPPRSGSAGLT
jgi:hypothetical protein